MKRAVLVLYLAVGACTDTFTERYSTLQAARDDQIFERGWLADVLPESAHTLRVSGDADINTAEGEFSFRSVDLEQFVSTLEPVTAARTLPEVVVGRARDLEKEGYTAHAYAQEQYTWIFLCSKEREHCEYRGWSER